MNIRIIKNDIRASKLITVTTTLFVAAAAMLVVLAAALIVSLFGSIDHLMTEAKTPHFLQMHSGDYDASQLEAFVRDNEAVAEYQVLEFLNVEGMQITIGSTSLSDSLLDNGFSVQSEKFDYLLDLDNRIIQPSDGEIYLPLSLMKDGTATVGDTVTVGSSRFVVAGFLRDSQMNSTLASSRRFLVSEADFEDLRNIGSMEYLIEFRLHDAAQAGAFETAWINAGIARNGPVITYPLFRLINALTDGLMIAVILLVSILVVAIALMCIRFTLLAKIEDDYREIGVMKAVGMRISDIKRIYLPKYVAIAAVGSAAGFALSYAVRDALLENIRLYMGESGNRAMSLVLGIVGVVAVFCVIVLYVNRVLGRFRKISAVDAVRFGMAQEKSVKVKGLALSRRAIPSLNICLGIKDVWSQKRLYLTMLVVLMLCVFIFLLPLNLLSTISSPEFVRYMGIGQTDLLIGIQQTDDIHGKSMEIARALDADPDVSAYTVLITKAFSVQMADGTAKNIRVELGDHTVFPVEYSAGSAPVAEDEIALSAMNADDLGMQTGDKLTLLTSQGQRDLTVCGIYSDITNGGKTAKVAFEDDSGEIMWSTINVLLTDKAVADAMVADYTQRYPFAKTADVAEYMDQTFGGTVQSIEGAAAVTAVIAPAISFLIALLFIKMLVAKEHYPIAVMKAVGFTGRDIRRQFLARGIFVLVLGLVLGTLLTATLGEALAGALLGALGVTSFRMIVDPAATYLICPLVIGIAILLATVLATSRIDRIKISENIKES